MTEEELARVALVLREAERVRALIAKDETAEEGAGDFSTPVVPVEEQSPAMVAVA
jgi:hypothetical protein